MRFRAKSLILLVGDAGLEPATPAKGTQSPPTHHAPNLLRRASPPLGQRLRRVGGDGPKQTFP